MAGLRRWLLLLTGSAFIILCPPGGESGPKNGRKVPDANRQASTDRYGDPLPEGAIARLGTVRLLDYPTRAAVPSLAAAGGTSSPAARGGRRQQPLA